jgi:hypothetical protein
MQPRRSSVPKRVKKPRKFETRKEIEAAAKKLVEVDKKKAASAAPVNKNKSVQNRYGIRLIRPHTRNLPSPSGAAAASKKAGLSKTWIKKTIAVDAETGGLTDDDAQATRPDFGQTGTAQAPRKNNVSVMSLSSTQVLTTGM